MHDDLDLFGTTVGFLNTKPDDVTGGTTAGSTLTLASYRVTTLQARAFLSFHAF